MSAGWLCEPINPDYFHPANEVAYEVEVYNEIMEVWERTPVDFGDRQTDDFTQAKRVYDTVKESGRKARIIEINTSRQQVPGI